MSYVHVRGSYSYVSRTDGDAKNVHHWNGALQRCCLNSIRTSITRIRRYPSNFVFIMEYRISGKTAFILSGVHVALGFYTLQGTRGNLTLYSGSHYRTNRSTPPFPS